MQVTPSFEDRSVLQNAAVTSDQLLHHTGRRFEYLELATEVADADLEEIMCRGTRPPYESLVGWEFAGTNSHPMTQFLPGPAGIGFRHFKKGFYRPISPRAPIDASPGPFIEGYNVVCKQTGVGTPHEDVLEHGRPKRHGYFRVYLPAEDTPERRYDDALIIDYALGANPTLDPSGRLRDYLVLFGHLDRAAPGLAAGTRLKEDDVLGFVGDTGSPELVHLHLEIRRFREALDLPKILHDGGPGALVAFCALLAGASLALRSTETRASAIALVATALVVVVASERTGAGFVMRFPKGIPRPDNEVATYEGWNPLSHVRVGPFQRAGSAFLWAPSPVTPPLPVVMANAQIDGEAATPVYEYQQPQQLNILRFDATTLVHELRPQGTACVIGIGGGRDLITALIAGHPRVLGVEINPAMVDMLRRVSARNPVLRDPRVEVIVGDGRSVYARSGVHCEVLQASLVDTWAATGAGAFAHTESTLYTREAWKVFLDRTAPAGIVTFSRWYDPTRPSETSRLLSLAAQSLRDRGVTRPRDHIALAAAGNVATILVSPSALTADDLRALHDTCDRMHFTLLAAPDHRPETALLDQLLDAPTPEALAALGAPHQLDTSPPSDERPFFFQLLHPSLWLQPRRVLALVRGAPGVLEGNVMAMFELVVTFFAVSLLGLALLGPTLWRAAREATPPLPGARAAVYFGSLGAGFMAAEIGLVQRMHVVLGHPTYALVFVLAGLLVATGVGSALSPRVLRTRKAVSVGALVAAVVLAAMPYAVIRPLARATVDGGFGLRAAWAFGCAALVGVVLGMMFPSGVRYVERERGAPVALAVNGATSVLGSVAAITVSVGVGIPATFLLAAAVYLVAALAGPHGWHRVEGAEP